MLGDIGLCALSPAVNDPGTAIAVLDAATRALADWRARAGESQPEVEHPRLRVAAIDLDAVLEDAFGALGREAVERHRARLRRQART